MNWLINIIICHLLFVQASFSVSLHSYLKNISSGKCALTEKESEVEVGCDYFYAKVKDTNWHAVEIYCDLTKPSVQIDVTDLNHDKLILWEKCFNQMNVSDLYYNNCPKIGTGINQSISILGLRNEVRNIVFKVSSFGLDNKLEHFFFANLSTLEILAIQNAEKKLILTNESFEGIPNVKKLFLYRNEIEEIPHGVFKHLIHLEELNLGGNYITTIDSVILDGIFLKKLNLDTNNIEKLSLNLPSLTHLNLDNNKRLTSLNVKRLFNLKKLSLENNFNLTSMPDRPFENTSLVNFKFTNGINFTVPKEFLSNLNGLEAVILTGCNIETVPENMIFNSPNIISLSLSSNRLIELPTNFFKNSNKIKILDLSGNKIKDIDHELLKPLISLEELNLSHNSIHAIYSKYFDQLTQLIKLDLSRNEITNIELLNIPKLNTLTLAHNNISSLLYSNEGISKLFFKNLIKLEELDLSHNSISIIEFGLWTGVEILKKINLRNNSFANIDLVDFNLHIEIDLMSNPIQFITVSDVIENNYENKSTAVTKLSLSSDKFICDGRNYEFGKYLQNQTSPENFNFIKCDLKCNGTNIRFKEQNLDNLTYDWNFHNGPNKIDCTKCACKYRPSDNSAIMDCSSRNMTQAPEPEYIISSDDIDYIEVILKNNSITDWPDYTELNIRKLDLSHNNLATINMLQLPGHLTNLYLDHNYLTKIDWKYSTKVLTKLQCLTMSYNKWECSCNDISTIYFLRNFSSQIIDKGNVTCGGDDEYNNRNIFYSLSEVELCSSNSDLHFMFILLLVIVVIVVVAMVLIFAFRNEIVFEAYKLFPQLFPDEYDCGEKYDAFVSFAHDDYEFVEQKLVPALENGRQPFKLCLHYRDWEIGKWIPDQIIDSVNKSYKTIIVLSSNFLSSYWGLLEYQIAFEKRLKERKNNMIIIIYGDLSIDDLDETMKYYVEMHTYIRWDDPKIWKRLRKVLRRNPIEEIETRECTPL